MEDIFHATSAIMAPYDPATVEIVVASVEIDQDGNSTVGWSDALNTTQLIEGAPLCLAARHRPTRRKRSPSRGCVTHILALLESFLTEGLTVEDVFYQRPRRVLRVLRIE